MTYYYDISIIQDSKTLQEWCSGIAGRFTSISDLTITLPEEEHKRINKIHSGLWGYSDEFSVPVYTTHSDGSTTTVYVKFTRLAAAQRKLEAVPCTCDFHAMLRDGCQCGAMQRERDRKSQADIPEPVQPFRWEA